MELQKVRELKLAGVKNLELEKVRELELVGVEGSELENPGSWS